MPFPVKKNFKFYIVIFTFSCLPVGMAFLIFNLGASTARAQDMSSTNYKIEGGNFNMTGGSKASDNYNISDTVGSTAVGLFNSQGFIIQTGFPYLTGVEPFRFSLSKTRLAFGNLTPNQPAIQQIYAVVENGLSSGYQVFAGQVKPLTSENGATIPDTRCDNPQKPCTINQAQVWKDSNAPGFGYGLSGQVIPTDFKNITYFRPFPNLSDRQDPEVIMSSRAHKTRDQTDINFKLNVSSSQPVGIYKNTIIFTAIPGY